MKAILRFLLLMVLALPLLCVCGCDDGGGGSAPTVDVTGTWRGTSVFAGESNSENLRLTQDGSNVTGTDPDGVNYSGSVSGNTLELIASVSNGGDTLSIEVSGPVEGNTMVLSGKTRGTIGGMNIDGPITYNLHR